MRIWLCNNAETEEREESNGLDLGLCKCRLKRSKGRYKLLIKSVCVQREWNDFVN